MKLVPNSVGATLWKRSWKSRKIMKCLWKEWLRRLLRSISPSIPVTNHLRTLRKNSTKKWKNYHLLSCRKIEFSFTWSELFYWLLFQLFFICLLIDIYIEWFSWILFYSSRKMFFLLSITLKSPNFKRLLVFDTQMSNIVWCKIRKRLLLNIFHLMLHLNDNIWRRNAKKSSFQSFVIWVIVQKNLFS